MRCPTDGAELVMAERQGVEIDYCPSCRGIWLDRGELDKILDRAASMPGAVPVAEPGPVPGGFPPAPAPGYGYGDRRPDDRPREGYRDGGYREGGYRDGGGYREGYRDDRRPDPRSPYGKKKKRESWLEDLLDFG